MTGALECTPEEKRAALERALRSRTFSRSEQLRSFLRYVCEEEIQGRAGDLNEYVIGIECLGRPEGYSPAEDSSVRTRAYELRHKLQKLYALELRDDGLQITMAKGGYAPQYVRTRSETNTGDAPADIPTDEPYHLGQDTPSTAIAPKRLPWAALAFIALGIAIGVAATLVAVRTTASVRVDPILAEAWHLFARPGADVMLCTATPLHLTVGPEGHEAYGTPSYPAPPEAYPLFRRHRPLPPGMKLGLLFTDNSLGVGTMNAVVTTANTLRTLGSTWQILPERVATLSALRGRNAILFGAPVDSEAIARVMEKTPLAVDYEPSVKEFVIRDRSAGTMIVPQKDPNGDFTEVYGIITVLNTRDTDRGRLGMMTFTGITSAGTHGAAEFFASPRSLQILKAIFAKEGVTGFPPAYQVVVKCTFSNMLLISYEYHSHKILQKD